MSHTFKSLKTEYARLGEEFSKAFAQYDEGKLTSDQLGRAVLAYDEFPHYLDSIDADILSEFLDWKRDQRIRSHQNA